MLTLWKVPIMPRLISDQKPSIVLVWIAPTTYSPLGVIDGFVQKFFSEVLIADPLIGNQQADFVRDGFMYKAFQSTRTDVLNHTGNNIALAADCASHDGFAGTYTTRSVAVAPMMPVFGFPAYESFVHLDDTAELVHVPLDQRGSDLVTHSQAVL